MFNQWLCVLFQVATGYMFGLALEHMLEVRQNALNSQARAILWMLSWVPGSIINVFFREIGSWYLIITVAFAIWAGKYWYRDAVWKKVAVMLLVYSSVLFGEILCLLCLTMVSVDVSVMDYTASAMMLGCCASTVFSFLILTVIMVVWNRLNKSQLSLRRPGQYVGILLGLALLLVFVTQAEETLTWFDTAVVAALFVYSWIMLVLAFNQSDKEHIQKELTEMTYQTRLEQQHYRHIEEKREEVAKLRHDYNNLLSSSLGLLREGRHNEAEELLASLLTRVQSTKEIAYCPIPVVNAILSEKQQECEREGIALSVDLPLPPSVKIAQIDLCSVFGNILDNAIRACSALPSDTPRTILLTAAMQGDYLIIRCDNPTSAEASQPREGGGYGLKILSEIASRYSGELKTVNENGTFSVRIVLMNANGV